MAQCAIFVLIFSCLRVTINRHPQVADPQAASPCSTPSARIEGKTAERILHEEASILRSLLIGGKLGTRPASVGIVNCSSTPHVSLARSSPLLRFSQRKRCGLKGAAFSVKLAPLLIRLENASTRNFPLRRNDQSERRVRLHALTFRRWKRNRCDFLGAVSLLPRSGDPDRTAYGEVG